MDINTIRDLARQHEGMEISQHWRIVSVSVEESCSGIALAFDVRPLDLAAVPIHRGLVRAYSLYEASRVLADPAELRARLGATLRTHDDAILRVQV